jgi:general secretion pathway protein G
MTGLLKDNLRRAGFTLVEVLIVVVILGILAAIVVPAFTSATTSAREATMLEDVRFMRTQIVLYQAEHNNTPPGYPGGNVNAAPTEADFLDQVTGYSDATGGTSPVRAFAFPFGPYLKRVPQSPVNGLDTVMVLANGVALPAEADDSTGWIYQPSTRTLRSNAAGNDTAGRPYYEY